MSKNEEGPFLRRPLFNREMFPTGKTPPKSLNRIGWLMPAANEAIDDLGCSWKFGIDPRAAVAAACRRSFRRWRLKRIIEALPAVCPPHPDVECTLTRQPTRLIDFPHVTTQLVRGRGKAARASDRCQPKWKAGPQWTQTRRASVLAWGSLSSQARHDIASSARPPSSLRDGPCCQTKPRRPPADCSQRGHRCFHTERCLFVHSEWSASSGNRR